MGVLEQAGAIDPKTYGFADAVRDLRMNATSVIQAYNENNEKVIVPLSSIASVKYLQEEIEYFQITRVTPPDELKGDIQLEKLKVFFKEYCDVPDVRNIPSRWFVSEIINISLPRMATYFDEYAVTKGYKHFNELVNKHFLGILEAYLEGKRLYSTDGPQLRIADTLIHYGVVHGYSISRYDENYDTLTLYTQHGATVNIGLRYMPEVTERLFKEYPVIRFNDSICQRSRVSGHGPKVLTTRNKLEFTNLVRVKTLEWIDVVLPDLDFKQVIS